MASDVIPDAQARRRVRPFALLIVAGLLLGLLALTGGVYVAVTWPSLSIVNAASHSTSMPRVFTQTYWVKNTGGSAVKVDSADTSSPAVITLTTSVRGPLTIGEGRTARIVMTYHVTDCANVPEVLPVNLRVDRWWGTQTITVQDHGHGFDGAYIACGMDPN